MAIFGNKGEWSEIYALFKLLGDMKVFTGDENLNKMEDLFYPVLKILREERGKSYEYDIEDRNVVFMTENGAEFMRLPVTEFAEQAKELFRQINANKGVFSVPDTEAFMTRIRCGRLKAPSADKTDIKIIIHDPRTGMCPKLGFSIKSKLGSPATLINASSATSFTYRITGVDFSDNQIAEINGIDSKYKIRDRLRVIRNYGGVLKFRNMKSAVFNNNLVMIDSRLPEILSCMLFHYYCGDAKTLADLTSLAAGENPMGYDMSQGNMYYEYKIKHFMTDAVMGLVPASVWNGVYQANGGYLVVKEDGDVLCYHFYDKNIFEAYLFHNLVFDTPSSTRHGFGKIIKSNNEYLFDLNLQVRFI